MRFHEGFAQKIVSRMGGDANIAAPGVAKSLVSAWALMCHGIDSRICFVLCFMKDQLANGLAVAWCLIGEGFCYGPTVLYWQDRCVFQVDVRLPIEVSATVID